MKFIILIFIIYKSLCTDCCDDGDTVQQRAGQIPLRRLLVHSVLAGLSSIITLVLDLTEKMEVLSMRM